MNLLTLLNLETGAPISAISRIISTAPKRYKEYDIPKRSGGKRRIAHPAKELKLLQRVILAEILEECPISDIATAYIKGRGILHNAQQHVGQRWLLKLDFKDFFHSITPKDWDRATNRLTCLKGWRDDKDLFHHILFWGRGTDTPTCLSIGAPTSPLISNLVCFKLDSWLRENAESRGLRVTRYADDITISGSNVPQLLKFERALENVLEKNRGLQLTLNSKKRGLYGPGERQIVTGLILTPDGKISIGRERKREIHALVHKYKVNKTDLETAMRAKGLVAFAISVERNFVTSLNRKYGSDVIEALLSTRQEPNPEYQDRYLF